MGLSADLISKFVKATKDDKTTKDESTLYGTVKIVDGVTYVQLDGSSVLTPVLLTASVSNGARVTVQIKNRVATITGNISDPSASGEDLRKLNLQIADWCDENDTTMINGAKIYTGSVTSKQINVADLFAQDITATGTITGLTLKGADISANKSYFISDGTTDQRFVYFSDGTLKIGLIDESLPSFDSAGFEFYNNPHSSFKEIHAYGNLYCEYVEISEALALGANAQLDCSCDIYGVNLYTSGIIQSNGEIQSNYCSNAFRSVSGDYGFIIRNDGGGVYFLLTNSGDPYGTFNSLRPFTITLSDGTVQFYTAVQLGSTVKSSGIYGTTTSAAANMYISPQNFLKRSTSASKYKLDIKDIEQGDALAYNVLRVSPRQWFDRSNIEQYSEYLTDVANNTLDETKSYQEDDVNLNPYYGLIAEDLVEAGLARFCEYGVNADGTQELEGIQYDRLPILFIPILRDLIACMQKILPSIKTSITDEALLSDISNIQERFALFSDADIIRTSYDVDTLKGVN
jgi:hypothetical protein